MMLIKRIFLAAALVVGLTAPAWACTSAIIAAKATRDGRTILWKHRDTDSENGFIARHDAPGEIGYVALYNGGSKKLQSAWTGMNDRGFAIMNTASYNVAQDSTARHDREGRVMAMALARCVTIDDFGRLLDSLPRPLGVQANFGVIDASGDGAYFETSDFDYVRYNLSDATDGVLVRTNYSMSGDSVNGKGYIRYASACKQLAPHAAACDITPELLTEGLSRTWYHGLLDMDMSATGSEWLREGDFIPRRSSAASIAIEGLKEGEDPSQQVMWTMIGFPPCSYVLPVTLDSVPEELQPLAPGRHSTLCDEVVELKNSLFCYPHDSSKNYIYLPALKAIDERVRLKSLEGYELGRARHR